MTLGIVKVFPPGLLEIHRPLLHMLRAEKKCAPPGAPGEYIHFFTQARRFPELPDISELDHIVSYVRLQIFP